MQWNIILWSLLFHGAYNNGPEAFNIIALHISEDAEDNAMFLMIEDPRTLDCPGGIV